MNRPAFALWASVLLLAAGLAGYGIASHDAGRLHYAVGYVVFVDHPAPPNRQFALAGKMDVVPGDAVFKISTEDGTFAIPRENVLFAGPDPRAAAVVGTSDPPAKPLHTSDDLLERVRWASEACPAALCYMGRSGGFGYYYLVQPFLTGSHTYKVPSW